MRAWPDEKGRGGKGRAPRENTEEDPVYSNSGLTGRNGWVKPDPAAFVDNGPPKDIGSILR